MDLSGVGTRRLGAAIVAAASLFGASTAVAAPQPTLTRAAPIVGSAPMDPFTSISNDTTTSTNWSGYAVESASKFTDVRGTWVEPSVPCITFGARYSSFWAGIDGYASGSVEQLGTDSDCKGFLRPSYYAWYEMYPAGSVTLSSTLYPVAPGDTLSAEVSVSGDAYTLTMHSSEGWTFTTTKFGFGLSDSSAEVIAESPEIGGAIPHLAELPDFGTVPFSNVEAAVGGGADAPFDTFTTNSGPHDIVGETDTNTVRALPSTLSTAATGDSFDITWKHS